MGRRKRLILENGLYHVVSRGNAKQPIYVHKEDYLTFLNLLRHLHAHFDIFILAYALMINHYHLLLCTPHANLAAAMRYLNGVYAKRFNKRHERVGHLFQGRYKAFLIDNEGYFRAACRYIALNPVKAGMVDHPKNYPWSSYAPTAGFSEPPLFLAVEKILEKFDPNPEMARRKYMKFILQTPHDEEEITLAEYSDIIENDLNIKDIMSNSANATNRKIFNRKTAMQRPHKPFLWEIFDYEKTKNKHLRNILIKEAIEKYKYSRKEIATFLKLDNSTISKILLHKPKKDIHKADGDK